MIFQVGHMMEEGSRSLPKSIRDLLLHKDITFVVTNTETNMKMLKEIYGLECRNFNDMNKLCARLIAMPHLLSYSYHDMGTKVLKIPLI